MNNSDLQTLIEKMGDMKRKIELLEQGEHTHPRINLGAPVELTIVAGVVTRRQSNHTIDTQADAATDDLDTINGGAEGDLLLLRAANSARTVVVKDATGNIHIAGDFSLDHADDVLELYFDGTNWLQRGRNDNTA